jgi:hypothetical protein
MDLTLRKIFDKILYEVDNSDILWYLLQPVLLPFLWVDTVTHSFDWSGSSSLLQIKLMSLWISDCNVSPPAWKSSARIWLVPGDLYFQTLK